MLDKSWLVAGKGWFTHHLDTDRVIGPYPGQNEALLASCLGTEVEALTAEMIKNGVIEDDHGNPLTPKDFKNWSDLQPSNQ